MSSLKSFEVGLEALIGRPTDLRPFVCDGSPLECEVFIVGFNPATSMSVNFWQFWSTENGFDKAAWLEAYVKDRQARPLKPGQTRRNQISNTRRVLNWILESAAPAKCLETNIYAAPTEQAADLAAKRRITAPFDYLLTNIKPKVIVAHGDDAVKYIQSMTLPACVIPESHFSRGWSEQRARELGQQVRSACKNA
jgi:hypothetical protein